MAATSSLAWVPLWRLVELHVPVDMGLESIGRHPLGSRRDHRSCQLTLPALT